MAIAALEMSAQPRDVRADSTSVAAMSTRPTDGIWSFIGEPPPSCPFPQSGAVFSTLVVDRDQRRLLLYGGVDDNDVFADVYTMPLDGPAIWSRIAEAGPAGGRRNHASIYDPIRRRMIVFGGSRYLDEFLDDLWAFSDSAVPAWSPIVRPGPRPSARMDASLVYDPVRDRLIVIGGYDGAFRSDVWAVSLADESPWVEIVPEGSGPIGRDGFHAVYDSSRDRVLLYGGWDGTVELGDLWSLDLADTARWTLLAASSAPGSRRSYGAAYDRERDRLVLTGGEGLQSGTWILALGDSGSWTRCTPPDPRFGQAVVFDEVRGGRVLAFGGYNGSYWSDLWSLSTDSTLWTIIAPQSPCPSPPPMPPVPLDRKGAVTAVDERHHLLLVYGGYRGAGHYADDAWTFDLAGDFHFQPLAQTGDLPPSLAYGTAIWDPVGDRFILFGGFGDEIETGAALLDETWELRLGDPATWTRLATSGDRPPARSGHTAIYDPPRRRMLIFGGRGANDFNDVWALNLEGPPAWSRIDPLWTPPAARRRHAAIYDPGGDRMIVFGGQGSQPLHDLWSLGLQNPPRWTPLVVSGYSDAQPSESAIYDAGGRRMLVLPAPTSSVGSWAPQVVWSVPLYGPMAWTRLDPGGALIPDETFGQTFAYDADRDRAILYQGGNSVFALTWGRDLATAPARVTSGIALAGFVPNPVSSRGTRSIAFTLADRSPARLEVLDVTGRRVFRREVGSMGAGDHRIVVNTALSPGVYFLHLVRGSVAVTTRGVVAH